MSMIITQSGIEVDIANFSGADVHLDDIAHNLTNIARFGGNLDFYYHYSVAEHSLHLVHFIDVMGLETVEQKRKLARIALLHDASEAYLGDVVSGVKALLPDYKLIEQRVQDVIYDKFKIERNDAMLAYVNKLDKSIMLNEVQSFVPQHYNKYAKHAVESPLYERDGKATKLMYRRKGRQPGASSKMAVYAAFLEMCEILGVS